MKIRFLTMVILCMVMGCGEAVSANRAEEAATAAGFTNVVVKAQHGVAPTLYGCAEGDAVAFDVQAVNPKGARVDLTICCGLLLKSCTIRH